MLRFLRKLILAAGGCFALLLVTYGIWAWWEIRELKGFCAEVRPGIPFSSLSALADKHGINQRWVRSGVADERSHDLFMAVPASSTMGDVICAVHYRQDTVVSGEMSGP